MAGFGLREQLLESRFYNSKLISGKLKLKVLQPGRLLLLPVRQILLR